jgi:hypothetical protein
MEQFARYLLGILAHSKDLLPETPETPETPDTPDTPDTPETLDIQIEKRTARRLADQHT